MQIKPGRGGAAVLPEVCARGRRGPRDGGAGFRALGRVWAAAAGPTGRPGSTGQCGTRDRRRQGEALERKAGGGACGVRGRAWSKACWVGDGVEGAWSAPVLEVKPAAARLKRGRGLRGSAWPEGRGLGGVNLAGGAWPGRSVAGGGVAGGSEVGRRGGA